MKPRKRIDEWSGRKQKSCIKMAGAHPKTVFSRWMGREMVLKYTETDNVLETISFQRQFPNRNIYYCRRPCSNLNHTGHTVIELIVIVHYCLSARCPLIRKLFLKPFDCFQNITGFCILQHHKYPFINPFIYLEMWSGMCTNHQSFCYIRLFQFLVSLILKHWNNHRILDYVTCVNIPLLKW